jgi:hypothetical protein
MDPRRTDLP